MGKSVRYLIRGVQGRVRANYNWGDISRRSVIHITAAEVKYDDRQIIQTLPPIQDFMYNLGEADVWVSNISPHLGDHYDGEPGGVEFILHVDWTNPIDVAITITLEDELPFSIGGYNG